MQKPQVFINFRGKDERKKLLPHLKYHLKASPSNLNVFTDDDAIGQPLQRLFKHIRNSRLAIVIFSVNYLESHWCLDELVEIRKCLKTEKIEFAVPIFYKVKAIHVKEQIGEFGANFLTLQNAFPDKIKKWKKALGFVADYGGLTYQETSTLSELDFVKKVVKKVDQILAESASNEISERKAENSIAFEANDQSQLHLSKTLEALNLERSYFQGFMHGSAWKDLISSMKSTNRFEIPLPESSVQFPMNLQSFDAQAQENESIERAINILALSMMRKQTQPALIFSNWDKLDHDTKNYIIYSAHKKSKIIKSYNGDVDSEPLFSSNFTPFVEEIIWDKTLEPNGAQVRPHRDHRRANSFHDNREQYYPLPYEMVWPVEPSIEPLAEAQGSNDNIGQRKFVVKRRDDNPGCFTSLCYCFKSCVSLT